MKCKISVSFFPNVFDASSLISIEKTRRVPALRDRHSDVVYPLKVSEEVCSRKSPIERFTRKHPHVEVILTKNEERRRLELQREPNIDPGEAAAIALAESRRWTLIIEDGIAKKRATRLGIKCASWREFVDRKV